MKLLNRFAYIYIYISKQSKTLAQFYSKRNLPVLAGFLRCRKAGV